MCKGDLQECMLDIVILEMLDIVAKLEEVKVNEEDLVGNMQERYSILNCK